MIEWIKSIKSGSEGLSALCLYSVIRKIFRFFPCGRLAGCSSVFHGRQNDLLVESNVNTKTKHKRNTQLRAARGKQRHVKAPLDILCCLGKWMPTFCPYVCHTRAPCKNGWTEWNTIWRRNYVVPSNILLDRGPGPPREGEIGWSKSPDRSDAAYRQITL